MQLTAKQSIIKFSNHLRVNAGAFRYNIPALFFDFIFRIFLTQTKTSASQKILIVRLDAIGDFLLWTDAAKALRILFPKRQFELILYGNELWTDLAGDLSVFDEVHAINIKKFKRNLRYRFQVFKKLRKNHFESALQPTYSRLLAHGDSLIRMANAKEKVAFKGDNSVESFIWKNFSDPWYTRLIEPDSHPLMELERNAEFIRELGLSNFQSGLPSLKIKGDIPDELKDKKYYVIFPGASVGRKQWPISNFAEIVKKMNEKYAWKGVICGGKNESTIAEQIMIESNGALINLTGKTSLDQLIAVISKAEIFIGNDTAAVHIAAATGTKAVSILGGGHFGRFLPYSINNSPDQNLPKVVYNKMECYGCGWKCIYHISKEKAAPCITNVTIDQVWNEIDRLLNS